MSRKTQSSVSLLILLASSFVSLAYAQAQNGISITPGSITKWFDAFGNLTDSVIYEDDIGRVGIGTFSPDGNLTVEGVVAINGDRPVFNGTILQLYNRANGNTNKWLLGTGGGFVAPDAFSIGDTNAYRLVIKSNGSVGIGTINPQGARKLDVQGGFVGVHGEAADLNGNGVEGFAHNGTNAWGVFGASNNGYAGYFQGRVHVNGQLSKSSGSFKIDHPLDPANKYLYHSFVESPDMMNLYNGLITLDESGEAIVNLPAWFSALNRDYRYQLTCIGGFAPVYIAEEISDRRFKIAGGQPGLKVSWQVTGIRQDAYANAHRIAVEEDKPSFERGFYLHPELFGQPEDKSIVAAHQAEKMRE